MSSQEGFIGESRRERRVKVLFKTTSIIEREREDGDKSRGIKQPAEWGSIGGKNGILTKKLNPN